MATPTNRAALLGGTADDIVDRAAELLARHGPTHASVQGVADAAGISKTALLRRFPAKAALLAVATDQCLSAVQAIRSAVGCMPAGPDRDHQVISGLVLLATSQPGQGLYSLLVRLAGPEEADGEIREALFTAFGTNDRPERDLRVLAALGALAAASHIRPSHTGDDEMRHRLIALGCDTLGRALC